MEKKMGQDGEEECLGWKTVLFQTYLNSKCKWQLGSARVAMLAIRMYRRAQMEGDSAMIFSLA